MKVIWKCLKVNKCQVNRWTAHFELIKEKWVIWEEIRISIYLVNISLMVWLLSIVVMSWLNRNQRGVAEKTVLVMSGDKLQRVSHNETTGSWNSTNKHWNSIVWFDWLWFTSYDRLSGLEWFGLVWFGLVDESEDEDKTHSLEHLNHVK